MKLEEFIEAIRKSDFQLGDSFWIDDFEFEVVSMSDRMKQIKLGQVLYGRMCGD